MSSGHNPNWSWKPSAYVRKKIADGNKKFAKLRRAQREQNATQPTKGPAGRA